MYLCIDKNYNVYKTDIITAKMRKLASENKILIIDLVTFRQSSSLRSIMNNEIPDNHWIQIPVVPTL